MKQNITLSLDKEIIRKSKILAANRETSVSGLLSESLRHAVEHEDAYEAAKRKALHNLDKGFHMGGKRTWKRDELHER
jgi:predicted transcriptional regulator